MRPTGPRSGRVHAIHQDIPFTTAMTEAVGREIEDLARWLALDLTATGLPVDPLPNQARRPSGPVRREYGPAVARSLVQPRRDRGDLARVRPPCRVYRRRTQPGSSSFGSPSSRPGLCATVLTPVRCGSSAVPGSAEPVDALAVLPFPAIGRQVAPAVRFAAVGIGDAVGIGELAGAAAARRIDEEPSARQFDGNRPARSRVAPATKATSIRPSPSATTSVNTLSIGVDGSLSDELTHTLVVSLVPAQGVSFPGNVGTGC